MTGYVRNDGALGSARKILNSSRWIRREKKPPEKGGYRGIAGRRVVTIC